MTNRPIINLVFLIGFLLFLPLATAKGSSSCDKFSIYRLQLRDKEGTDYSLKHPDEFLSARALERRARQGLAVDSTDLPLSRKYVDDVKEKGFQVIGGSKWNNTLLVRVPDSTFLSRLHDLDFVTQATRVYSSIDTVYDDKPDHLLPDSTLSTWKSTSHYGKGERQISMLDGKKLHQAGFEGQGMLIAIIDGGFMNADKIPLLKDAKVLGARDCVYPYKANVYNLLDHGTMVLSTMATDADSAFVGTAPKASFFLLRSEDGHSENLVEEDYWAQAAEIADSLGADVINSSLGYTRFDDSRASHKYHEQDGRTALISATASRLASKGIILVNSAGNDGMGTWKRINFPGDARDVLTVAALSGDSINARFSSVGPSIDGRVKPDVSAMGYQSTVIRGNGHIVTANGTSFSSPEVCGMVACLWQALPQKTASQIMDLVRRSANQWNYPDNVYGYGIPDFWKAYQMGKEQ